MEAMSIPSIKPMNTVLTLLLCLASGVRGALISPPAVWVTVVILRGLYGIIGRPMGPPADPVRCHVILFGVMSSNPEGSTQPTGWLANKN
jgi:hypothetical protein